MTAEPGATLSSVAQQLRTAAGVSAPGRLFAGLDPLEDDAPLGRPLLVDGARLWLDVPGTPATLIGSLALYVVSGPDAGGVHLLTPKDDGYGGELPIRIGRGADADIRVDDPDISRIHGELLVRYEREQMRVFVRDLGSTNGMTLDGAQVGGAPVEMRPGSLLRVGESSIALSVEAGGFRICRCIRTARAMSRSGGSAGAGARWIRRRCGSICRRGRRRRGGRRCAGPRWSSTNGSGPRRTGGSPGR
ncbi:FHA domain-containing protein [Catenulispora yoronensis]